MNPTDVLDIGRDAVFLLLKISGPMMLVAMLSGLTVALFQALTQIQEMTLTFVPKIVLVFLTLILALPFIASSMGAFTMNLFQLIARV
ncbi:MAG: flagellar biosynthesis protein FliQ [Alphaproteobacteria bacterium]|nr:flagellar biosynthesis protein FliQ [Alphaproteobacteria bacterium]